MSMSMFLAIYDEEVRRSPERLSYVNVEGIDEAINRMKMAIQRGRFNVKSPVIRATCHRLDIPCSHRAIETYVGGFTCNTHQSSD